MLWPTPSAVAQPPSSQPNITHPDPEPMTDAIDYRELATGIYLVVAGVLLLRLLTGLALTWRLARRARPVCDALGGRRGRARE